MKYFYMALLAVVVFAACNKTPQAQAPSMEEMLRTGKWKVASGTITIKKPDGRDTVLDYVKYVPYCHKDDYITFDSQLHGAIYSSSIKCNPGDPDHIDFLWNLRNNYIDMYNGFTGIHGVTSAVEPLSWDTLSIEPWQVDTILGTFDTLLGYTKTFLVVDSIRILKIDSTAVPLLNVYNAVISNFSQSEFTLRFYMISTRLDTTGWHAGPPAMNPIVLPDTFRYTLKYTNF